MAHPMCCHIVLLSLHPIFREARPLALTDLIERDLLAALDGASPVDDVLHRYAGSKGPLYAALARATAAASERLSLMQAELDQGRQEVSALAGKTRDEAGRSHKARREAMAAEAQLRKLRAALEHETALLGEAQRLRAAGFDEASLAALSAVFSRAAQAQGAATAEIAGRFVSAAQAVSDLPGLERAVAEAQARAQAAEAKAHERERDAKVRDIAVAWAAWFVRRGISDKTVASWQAAAEQLGLGPADLAHGLAQALREFGTLEVALRERAKVCDALAAEGERLEAGNAALSAERERLSAALEAVAKEGSRRLEAAERRAAVAMERLVGSVEQAGNNAAAQLAATLERVEQLQAEAAQLGRAVAFARALVEPNTAPWLEVRPQEWQALLAHFVGWLAQTGSDGEVSVPDALKKTLEDQARYPALYGTTRLPMRNLVRWLMDGLVMVALNDGVSIQDGAQEHVG